ncbi:MAG TPA: NUDIX domain-containing protein [Micromonosporaceae bacterium]|nr:NUDIX domain-containing protein [Micromonosporaceae bacterium]
MERRRRIAAYGVCRDDRGRILLVRASSGSNMPGLWLIPGGGIAHGEDPAVGAVREIAEETGLSVEVVALRDVLSDVSLLRDRDVALHHDRVIYDVAHRNGTLRNEQDGTTDTARWVVPDELPSYPLMPFTALLFDLPAAPATEIQRTDTPTVGPPAEPARPRGQRFAVYAVATDPADRVLLTRNAEGYPGAGRWHLPGGGTDFGEQPAAALLRELAEETNQVGRITDLLGVTHRHNPAALGPEGYPIDWHTVRVNYRVVVDQPTQARVLDAGGSTAAAGWFTRAEAARLHMTEATRAALTDYAQ